MLYKGDGNMQKINNHELTGILPVINIPNASLAVSVAEALRKGGVNSIEVTLRSPDSLEYIKNIKSAFADMTVGAGTVLNLDQCKLAIEMGAKFIVSPGLSKAVADVCREANVPYLPGVVTPTEIMAAIDLGLTTLKFFPAGVFGGLKAIKALGAAFPAVKFMPTGGVSNENLSEFIACDKIIACGGSWVCKKTYEETVKVCLEARKIIKGE